MTMIQIGDVLEGKYAVERVIGRGGTGLVLAALHTTLKRRVALKLLRRDMPHDPDAAGRLVREGRVAAQIQSEHVARVLDTGSLPVGEPFLVLEHLEGRDLAAVLRQRGRVAVAEAVDYVRQACSGLAATHALGIVHRDVKPSNLFLTARSDGAPLLKIVDFGIAKGGGHSDADALTTEDMVMGSPPYMPPEQLRAERDADARSDIWALGAVLFTLLAGKSPFERRYLTETCQAILSGVVPDLGAVRADVPRPLGAIVARCLAPKVEDRFESVEELRAALAPFTEEDTTALLRWFERARGTRRRPSLCVPLSSGAQSF